MSSETRTLASLGRRICLVGRDQRGIAAIEFGAVMSAIVVITLATYDIGNYVLREGQYAEAAQAGGLYATSFPTDTAGMTCAAEAALCPGVTYSLSSGCSSVSCPLPTITIASSTTGSGSPPERFVTVTLTGSYSPLLLTTILTTTSAQYVAQVQ